MTTPIWALEKIRAVQERGSDSLILNARAGERLPEFPLEILQLTHLRALFLSGHKLTQLPPEIAQLTVLQELVLSGNQLISVPEAILNLPKLRTLNLRDNQLCALPTNWHTPYLTELDIGDNPLQVLQIGRGWPKRLSRLELSSCRLQALPPEIELLRNLRMLEATRNPLTTLPAALGQLAKLRELRLTFTQLDVTTFPPDLSGMVKLQQFDLSNTPLGGVLPVGVTSLPALAELRADGCRLTGLLPEIGRLKTLHTLRLCNNKIHRLPAEFGQLENLRVLHLNYNPLRSLPPEFVQLRNLKTFHTPAGITEYDPVLRELCRLQRVYVNPAAGF